MLSLEQHLQSFAFTIFKKMKRILKIWRYCTIGVIISLLGITIILMGCRTNTNLTKGVNKSIMNEPIVTY